MYTIHSLNDQTGTPHYGVMARSNDWAEIVKVWHRLHRIHGRMISQPCCN